MVFTLVKKFPSFYETQSLITGLFLPYYNVKMQYIEDHLVRNPLFSHHLSGHITVTL